MRTTNCKISMLCSVSSICHFISDVCQFNFYLPFTKKLLLCIFASKVGYVIMYYKNSGLRLSFSTVMSM